MPIEYAIPPPDDQLAFFEFLLAAKGQLLQEALLKTVSGCDLAAIDADAQRYVPADALCVLAGRGLRAELVFALPTILRANPRLLGYYRLLLGFSQKSFYTKAFGLSGRIHTAMEQEGTLVPGMVDRLPSLCLALNESAAHLVRGIGLDRLTRDNLRDLSLLTFGPQLRSGTATL
ncbi:MAG: XcyI family restriction endonuclease [Bacillota bacterium]|nr:XcyI family restriction endonuclease [Bacillota bacterium]